MSDLFARLGATAVRSARPRPVSDPFASDAVPERTDPVDRSAPAPAVRTAATETGPTAPVPAASVRPRPDEPEREVESQVEPVTAQEATRAVRADPDAPLPASRPTEPQWVPAVPRTHPVVATVAPAAADRDVHVDVGADDGATGDGASARVTQARATTGREVAPPAPGAVVTARRRDPDPVFAPAVPDTTAPPATDSRPAVRIHIGRLDVRADLASSSPSRPTHERRRTVPEPISLDDYLSGRKDRR